MQSVILECRERSMAATALRVGGDLFVEGVEPAEHAHHALELGSVLAVVVLHTRPRIPLLPNVNRGSTFALKRTHSRLLSR